MVQGADGDPRRAENTTGEAVAATVISTNTMADIRRDFKAAFEYDPPAEETDQYAEDKSAGIVTK